jgi:hypothetical protein
MLKLGVIPLLFDQMGSSDSRPQRDANRDFSDRHQSPQGDQQLSGKRHDHCPLSFPATSSVRPRYHRARALSF